MVPRDRVVSDDDRLLGVDVDLAPVADLPSVDGSALAGRAFTSDPDAATAAVAESIAGWQGAGVATTVKHFPGLGGATVNTDDGPSTIERTRDQLDDDLAPFVWAVEAGTQFVAAADDGDPAVEDLGRARLGQRELDDVRSSKAAEIGLLLTLLAAATGALISRLAKIWSRESGFW